MYHYINNTFQLNTIYSAIKYVLADIGESSTYIRPDNPNENAHEIGHTNLYSSAYGNKIQSNISCKILLTQLTAKGMEIHLLPGLSHRYIISIEKICDAGCKTIFDKHTVTIKRMKRMITKGCRDHQNGILCFTLQTFSA